MTSVRARFALSLWALVAVALACDDGDGGDAAIAGPQAGVAAGPGQVGNPAAGQTGNPAGGQAGSGGAGASQAGSGGAGASQAGIGGAGATQAGASGAGTTAGSGSTGLAGMGGSAAGAMGIPAAGTMSLPTAGTQGQAGTGTSGDGGSDAGGATAPTPGDGSDPASVCPAPPAEASAAQVAALNAVNAARLAAGSGCATMIQEINLAASNHCAYFASNDGQCVADPHSEVEGCEGFTGRGPFERMRAAGYQSRGGSEVMAFVNDPEGSVATWIDSVWHRLPILDPWTTELGYGAAEGCDTIDFGPGTPAPNDTVVVWPYDGQVAVPLSFDGRYEGPMPPAPTTGWPSAYPITVYGMDLNLTEHSITVDGDSAELEHVWLTGADSDFLRSAVFMYPNEPFSANTTYRVRVSGSYVGGPLALEWTFTTGEERRWGFGN